MGEEKEKSLPAGDGGTPFTKGRTKLSTEPYKGVRDFYPEDMAVQNYIFSTWKKVCGEFGYQEYSASPLESAELYRSKGNDEIVNEQMFTFTDRGGREVALRPEMTPTVARMVAARRKSLKFPLRWFSVANFFRYERPQRGRKREHFQLNADLLGEKNTLKAEVEIIELAYKIMRAFGAREGDFEIKINSRKITERVLRTFNIDEQTRRKIYRITDSWEKGGAKTSGELALLLTNKAATFENYLSTDNLTDLVQKMRPTLTDDDETVQEIKNLLIGLQKKGLGNVKFTPHITRGFDYYTGMVFEVFDTHSDNRRSLFGGGRYDNLLEIFGVEPVPTVGFGMGDVTIRDFLETHKLPLTKG